MTLKCYFLRKPVFSIDFNRFIFAWLSNNYVKAKKYIYIVNKKCNPEIFYGDIYKRYADICKVFTHDSRMHRAS